MQIELKSMEIENFKGIRGLKIGFGHKTEIKGRNASGKTSVFDALSWLLFGSNSNGDSKFGIRPLDTDGNTVDNIYIIVKAVFEIDGKEVELSRTQKQRWVKHRGEEQAKFEGNVDEYSVDGYPKSAKEYSSYIASIIDTDAFKMLVNPAYFTGLPWKEQRQELMKFVTELSDAELARSNPEFTDLLPELEKAPSLDDIQKKYTVTARSLKQKQTEIPVRIDEAAKSKIEYDFAELEIAKNSLTEQIAYTEQQIASGGNEEEIKALEQEKFDLHFDINDRKRELLDGWRSEKIDAEDEYKDCEREVARLETEIANAKTGLAKDKERRDAASKEKDALGAEYKKIQAEQFKGTIDFDESKWTEPDTVCPYCGQELPKERIDRILAEHEEKKAAARKAAVDKLEEFRKTFQHDKQEQLDKIKEKGFALKDEIEGLDAAIASIESELPRLNEQKKSAGSRFAELKKKLEEYAEEPNIDDDEEYKKLLQRDADIAEQIKALRESGPDVSEYEQKKTELQEELAAVNGKLSQSARNIEVDERIEELEKELRETSQEVADCEKMLYLLEKFVREKMNRVSDEINRHFKMVKFKLFTVQINGGIKETCECTYSGIPYSDLNAGHRILAGIDIITALSELYGVNAMLFVDDAEALSSNNTPKVEQQLVLLTVTDDEELTVESEG